MSHLTIKIKPQINRLDKFLPTQLKTLSRSQVKKLINEGKILVNDRKVDPDLELQKGNSVRIDIPPPAPREIKAENIPLKIVYEDSDLLVIDKSEGMVVHPTLDHPSGTLVNALLFYLKLPSEEI